jgi:hypothetical protein
VITFNVDDNPGLIEPFVKQRGFSFPVLPAKNLVDQMVPLLEIPRNWIVDQQGVAVRESVGFGFSSLDEAELVSDVVRLLEAIP